METTGDGASCRVRKAPYWRSYRPVSSRSSISPSRPWPSTIRSRNLQHPLRSFAARHAFSAGFILREIHEEPGNLNHTGLVIHDNQSAGSDHGSDLLQRIEIKRDIQLLLCQTSAGRTADLYSLEFGPASHTSADIKDNLAKGCSHGNFDQTGILDLAGQGKCLGARAVLRSDGAIPCSALGE